MGISLISSRRWLGWLAVLLLPGVASADTLNQADTA